MIPCALFIAPIWYSQYRFYLSILVGTCIIGSLAGTSYYGPVAGHGLISHELYLIREERSVYLSWEVDVLELTLCRNRFAPKRSGVIKGDIEAVSGGEDGDSYVVVRHKSKPEETSSEGPQGDH